MTKLFFGVAVAALVALGAASAEANPCNRHKGDYLGSDGKCHRAGSSVAAKGRSAAAKAASVGSPSKSGTQNRAAQQARCDEQAAKRRALGVDSRVVWDNPHTCRATGGYTQTGAI